MTVYPSELARMLADELFCEACAVCWDPDEMGESCPKCGGQGEPSSFEADADEEMGL